MVDAVVSVRLAVTTLFEGRRAITCLLTFKPECRTQHASSHTPCTHAQTLTSLTHSQASILRIGDYVYFANPASKSSRVNLTLRRASAAGPPPIAWTGAASKSLYYGPSAYSCLATLNATHMAVAFENGILDPNDYISIVAVELEFSADQ